MGELVQERETRRVGSWRDDGPVAVVAAGAAALVWAVERLMGVDLAVRSGSGVREVGLVSVIVTAVVVTLAAGGLLRVLERRTPRARRLWTGTARRSWSSRSRDPPPPPRRRPDWPWPRCTSSSGPWSSSASAGVITRTA